MEPFTERVIAIIKGIPSGKVMTYGQIAALAGSHRGARQVVRVLHTLSEKYKLPWHRVVNIKGEISINNYESCNMQRMFLESEGIEFDIHNTINLNEYQFHEHNRFKEDL